VRVKITICVKITFFVYKTHSRGRYQTRECQIQTHTCQNYSLVSGNHTLRMEIAHCMYCACRNQTRECHNLTHTCENHTLRVEVTLYHIRACQNHNACEYHTSECHIHTHTCQNYSRMSRNHTLRAEIILCV
jgi:hypothetical protein